MRKCINTKSAQCLALPYLCQRQLHPQSANEIQTVGHKVHKRYMQIIKITENEAARATT